MSEDELLGAINPSRKAKKVKKSKKKAKKGKKTKTSFSKAKIGKIKKEFNESRYKFSALRIKEIRENLDKIKKKKAFLNQK